tara:strand:+ start:397 stop:717 length:321 start_codon:yes stop_codon:yes gene_type:complete
MPFKPGNKKKGGRKKGTKNLVSKEIRANAALLLESELDVFKEKLPKLNDADYLKAIAMLFKHVLPSQKQIETDTIEHPINFQVEIIDRLSQVSDADVDAEIMKSIK